jgi:hypothetical protein
MLGQDFITISARRNAVPKLCTFGTAPALQASERVALSDAKSVYYKSATVLKKHHGLVRHPSPAM